VSQRRDEDKHSGDHSGAESVIDVWRRQDAFADVHGGQIGNIVIAVLMLAGIRDVSRMLAAIRYARTILRSSTASPTGRRYRGDMLRLEMVVLASF
jgi:hypothetical protein